jgi:hypothetical protein
MRKSIIIFIGALWLLALFNMWLLMRAGDEHARVAALRASASRWHDPPRTGGISLSFVNVPSDFPVTTSGPPRRPRHAPHASPP